MTAPTPNGSSKLPWVSLFFDDLGHELDQDEADGRLTNVAKLFQAHPGLRTEATYRFYYPCAQGLASVPPASDWSATLSGGDPDCQYSLRHALYDLSQTFAEVSDQGVRQLALFGCGHGGALAWRLCRILARQGVHNPKDPARPFRIRQDFRIRFLGLFDVIGNFATEVRAGGPPPLGELPEAVEAVVHCVAAHERRTLFDLQSIRSDPALLPGAHRQEILYPGVHGDVTGGYGPGEQGRENTLARIPLNRMLEAAIAHQVPFPSLTRMNNTQPALYQEFSISRELAAGYSDYRARLRQEPHLYRELGHHECLYFRWLQRLLSDSGLHLKALARLEARRDELRLLLGRPMHQARASISMAQARPLPRLEDGWPTQAKRRQQEEELLRLERDIRSLNAAYAGLREQYLSLQWRRIYLDGGFPEFPPPVSALAIRHPNQLSEQDVLYRHQGDRVLVVPPLRPFERDMLTWMKVAEPLPAGLQRFFLDYVHDAIAHAPLPGGDRYFQRRSIFFRRARPWRG